MKKQRIVSFRIDEGEYKDLERRAKNERMSVSEYIRRKVLAAYDPGFVWTSPTTTTATAAAAVGATYTVTVTGR